MIFKSILVRIGDKRFYKPIGTRNMENTNMNIPECIHLPSGPNSDVPIDMFKFSPATYYGTGRCGHCLFLFFLVFFFARLSRSCGRHMLHSHPLEVTFTSTDHLVNNLPLLHEHESRHCLHCPFLCNSLQGKKSSPLFSLKQLTDS